MLTGVIVDITDPISNASPTAAPAAAKETAPVPLGGLIEQNGRVTIRHGYPSAK